ncbi:MAG: LptF/LptG family permease [Epsilonproteobacteria bacterium]|nr:LptF/LptG family permease [Campylobacterota bacterium]
MNRVDNYILKHFMSLFSSLFFILFSIASIVFFIKIASITSIIQINFLELLLMFVYLIPRLLLYTIPVTFFLALCITLFNLSKENELAVLFTLGHSPKKISQLFLALAAVFSILMVIDIVILIPISRQLNDNFIEYKKAEAKFNIQASKFGQKFSNWIIYVKKVKKNHIYENVALYQKELQNKPAKLILARTASIENTEGILRLILNKGKAFEFKKDEIQQVDFQKMYINTKYNEKIGYMKTIYNYWNFAFQNRGRAYNFAFFILIAFFPFSTVFLALGLSIVISRYSSNKIYLYMFLSVLSYISLVIIVAKINPFYSILIVPLVTIFISYLIYKKRVALKF